MIAISRATLAVALLSACDPRAYQGEPLPEVRAADLTTTAAAAGGASSSGVPADPDGKSKGSQTVVLELRGEYPEVPGAFSLTGGSKTLRDLIKRIERIAADDDVRTLVVRIAPLSMGLASAEEIRAALVEVAQRKKTVACHLETGGNLEYYLSTVCKTVALSPAGDIFLVGPHVEMLFVKGLLDKLGVVADFEHQGKYKGAADSYTRESMSPEQREAIDGLLDGATRRLVDAVASARGLGASKVRALLDQAPFSAARARQERLVDRLANFEAFRDEVSRGDWKMANADEPKPAMPSLFDLFGAAAKPAPKGPRVALVYLVGPIVHGKGGGGLFPAQEVASREVIEQLEKIAADDDIKAVVLRIDSPGGSALASDLIWAAVRAVADKKPVIASMGDVAASGGYYIAAGAQKIYAQPDTITGSIGVIGGKLVLAGLYDKLGLHKDIVTRGARAAMFTEARPFTPDERVAVTTMMHDVYAQFLDRVVGGRHITRQALEPVAQGRVWSGADAQTRRLVDTLGGLSDALADARSRGKLPADSTIETYPPAPTLKDFVDRLGGSDARLQLLALLPDNQATRALSTLHSLLTFEHDHIQLLLPFSLRIN